MTQKRPRITAQHKTTWMKGNTGKDHKKTMKKIMTYSGTHSKMIGSSRKWGDGHPKDMLK